MCQGQQIRANAECEQMYMSSRNCQPTDNGCLTVTKRDRRGAVAKAPREGQSSVERYVSHVAALDKNFPARQVVPSLKTGFEAFPGLARKPDVFLARLKMIARIAHAIMMDANRGCLLGDAGATRMIRSTDRSTVRARRSASSRVIFRRFTPTRRSSCSRPDTAVTVSRVLPTMLARS